MTSFLLNSTIEKVVIITKSVLIKNINLNFFTTIVEKIKNAKNNIKSILPPERKILEPMTVIKTTVKSNNNFLFNFVEVTKKIIDKPAKILKRFPAILSSPKKLVL